MLRNRQSNSPYETNHRPSRRRFLRLTAAGVAVTGFGGIAAAKATASPNGPIITSETYKGHKIEIVAGSGHHGLDRRVLIDGVELHVMRVPGTGEFVSGLAHYDPKPTLELTARAAVDTLGRKGRIRPFRDPEHTRSPRVA